MLTVASPARSRRAVMNHVVISIGSCPEFRSTKFMLERKDGTEQGCKRYLWMPFILPFPTVIALRCSIVVGQECFVVRPTAKPILKRSRWRRQESLSVVASKIRYFSL